MGMIECNDEANNFKYKLVLETTVESLRLAIEGKTGTSVAENCYAFIEAVEGISTGGDCTDCENNLQSCMDAKALLETEVNDLNSQITTLTNDLNTCTTDKEAIQSNLDDCIAEKVVIQDALDTANVTIGALQYRLDTVNTQLDNILGRTVAGTEVEKMTKLAIDKSYIKNAIEIKTGTTLTEDFSTYSTSIDAIPLDSYIIEPWEEQAGRDKFVGVVDIYQFAVNEVYFEIRTTNGGTLSIDWGDGTIEDVPSGILSHAYDYYSLESTVFNNSKKQAIIKIVPTDNAIDRFGYIHSFEYTTYNTSIAKFSHVKMETDNSLDLIGALQYQTALRTFEFIGNCNASRMTTMFARAGNSLSVKFKNIKDDTPINYIYYYCDLSSIAVLDGSLVPSTLDSTFRGITKTNYFDISSIIINAQHTTSAYYMLGGTNLITNINFINTHNITNWGYFALDCYALKSLDIDMSNALTAVRAFEDLWELETINLTLLPVSTDITNCYLLPASEIENLILNQLKDVSENDTNEVLKLTGTVTEDELSQDALDHAVAYGWDLVF